MDRLSLPGNAGDRLRLAACLIILAVIVALNTFVFDVQLRNTTPATTILLTRDDEATMKGVTVSALSNLFTFNNPTTQDIEKDCGKDPNFSAPVNPSSGELQRDVVVLDVSSVGIVCIPEGENRVVSAVRITADDVGAEFVDGGNIAAHRIRLSEVWGWQVFIQDLFIFLVTIVVSAYIGIILQRPRQP